MKYVSYVVAFILFTLVGIFGYRLVKNQVESINKQPATIEQISLSEYTKTGTKLRFKISGPVVAEEKHEEMIFEVGQGSRTVKIIKGYNGSVVKELALPNNYNAYESFASAVYSTGFSSVRESQKDKKYMNECPDGNLYTAELVSDSGELKSSLWKSSCSSKTGSLNAGYSSILSLFRSQFPDYDTFTSELTID